MDSSLPSSGTASLAQADFDSIPDTLVVLDPEFRIIAVRKHPPAFHWPGVVGDRRI